ncbi:hypothetical protein LINGRAHAP2_LOCUS8129 [Linum grandiflorum]
MKWFVDENGLSHSKSVLAEEMNGLINKAQRFEANNPNLDPDLDDVLDETLLPESQRSPIESHEPSYKVREILEPYPLVHHTVARNFISNVPFNSFLRGNRDTSKHMPVSGHIYALEHCPNLGNPSSLQSDPIPKLFDMRNQSDGIVIREPMEMEDYLEQNSPDSTLMKNP